MKRAIESRAFSLLEIVLVLFVLGMLAAVTTPSVREIVERGRRDAEVRNLEALTETIVASFQETDLSALNVAALPGTIGAADTPTVFSTSTSGTYGAVSHGHWFAKVGRLRGLAPLVGGATAAQPELARIAHNGMGNPRLLLAGPAEGGRQRFLLVSLVARAEQLQLPAYEATAAWFDAIWNHEWENRSAAVPAFWNGRLTPAALGAWNAVGGGGTQTHKLCVRRIVLPKFRVTVNNNHATETAFVSYNNSPAAFSAAPASGASVTPEILGGRLVTINRGPAWPGTEALRFTLRENPTVTLQ